MFNSQEGWGGGGLEKNLMRAKKTEILHHFSMYIIIVIYSMYTVQYDQG